MDRLSQNEILRSSSRALIQRPQANIPKPRRRMWHNLCNLCTLLIPDFVLRLFGMKTRNTRSAWREKYTLCFLIFLSCCFLAFLTYGMNFLLCKSPGHCIYSKINKNRFKNKTFIIANGYINFLRNNEIDEDIQSSLKNMSNCFKVKPESCRILFGGSICKRGEYNLNKEDFYPYEPIYYTWNDIKKLNMIVIDNKVYDPSYNNEEFYEDFIRKRKGCDGSDIFNQMTRDERDCFKESFYAGLITKKSSGCLVADCILYLSTVVIFGLIISRFILATFYSMHIKRKMKHLKSPLKAPTICFVACYSEGREGLKTTLDSLSEQDYKHKLIVVVADGIIKGSDNNMATPDILLDLIEVDKSYNTEPKSYISLADGSKRHNRAMVYAGKYKTKKSSTNIILIIKCGNINEDKKAGNRGKRDSQVIIISLYYKLLYDDRFSELDYDIYKKMKQLTGIDPVNFELILMVDADTRVKSDALTNFVSLFEADQKIMGMCGETKIQNKCESWVSMIQVFEYYISHHLTKSFESVFGGVTCLPGCFCMYRIYSVHHINNRKAIMPIISNAFILNAYSVFNTDTLHKKNLLLLGEDRYLTTILLKHFYRRKLIFVPSAQCETFVPSKFKILLSQRRRWINSTVHNLFELVLVDKLCGTFCCSMQFVVLMELFGTLVLPAAIVFTGVLITVSIVIKPEWIPLIMLWGILGLPAFLILLTTKEISYIFWLFVYILSLPIWNFILPVYAFWHFDDFSWGETRKIEGDETIDGDAEGEFNPNSVSLRHLSKLESPK